jgi:hypothetical protein
MYFWNEYVDPSPTSAPSFMAKASAINLPTDKDAASAGTTACCKFLKACFVVVVATVTVSFTVRSVILTMLMTSTTDTEWVRRFVTAARVTSVTATASVFGLLSANVFLSAVDTTSRTFLLNPSSSRAAEAAMAT